MRMREILCALVIAASFALTGPARAESAPPARALAAPIGKGVTVAAAVTVERANAAAVVQANVAPGGPQVREGDLVYRGDVVSTGADGKVSLVFADGTAFNVSSNARMELNEFVYNPDGKSNSSMFSLLKG